ncbi:MAG: two-component regulator propeller domain-containing protein, partial [Segetibacter sp.]
MLDNIPFNFIIQDSIGNLWFGTHEDGVSKFDGKTFTNYTTTQGLADNYVRCMIQDKKGNLWFGTDAGGVSKYNGSSFTNYTKAEGLANNSVNSIARDKAGNLWFGTNAGVSKYDSSRFTNYTTAHGLADNNVFCIIQDKDDNLWFGTHTKGVSKFDGSRFTNYTKTQGLAGNIVNSILQDRVGNLWFTSQGGGVSKYEGRSFTNYTTAQGLADNFVHCMIQDKKGNLWFGTDRGGVSKYEGNSFTNYTTAQGLPSNAVLTMMQDKAGNIWFGTRGSGVSKYDGKSFTNYTTAHGLAGNNIWSIIQDKAGNIWFGTHEGGASKYDGNSFTNYTMAEGLPGNAISAIHQDKNAHLWFGTDGKGVSKYDGKNFTEYTTEHGLADNEIWCIAEDHTRNMIWFGTNRGLSGLKQKGSTNSNKQEHEFENFNKNTGYPIKDVSTGALLVDNKGIVWAGSGEGKLIRFDYSAVNKNTDALNLKIQAVKLNNETICWNNLLRKQQGNKALDSLTLLSEMIASFGKVLAPKDLDSMSKKYRDIKLDGVTRFYSVPVNLVLPYDYNNISIDFVAIEPARPKQVQYQYKLEGYSDDWSPPSNNSTAVFGNMRQGNYTFKLKALSPFGGWSETAYSFKVLPPWWATWWAYTLYGLMAGAILYTFYRDRIRRIERRQATQINIMVATQEEERKRISRDLHDDIGARLTNINILSALGQQKINEPQEASEYLKRISNEIQTSA